MIDVFLDNNALEFICSNSEFERYLSVIETLHQDKVIRIHFNILLFCEQIAGLTPASFTKAKRYVIWASKLCGKSILLPRKDHVRQCLLAYSDNQLREADSYWRRLLQEFCRAKNYETLSQDLHTLRDALLCEKRYFQEGAMRIKDECRSFKQRTKSAGKIPGFSTEDPGFPDFRQFVFDKWVDCFELSEIARRTPGSVIDRRLKPLYYLTDAYIYYNMTLYGNHNPKESDMYDLYYLLYLNICDYLITRDSKLHSIMDNCGNDELHGRAITPDAFLEMLDTRELKLEKRAPDKIAQLPV